MVTVHHFRVWDPVKDEWVYPPLKSPEDRIRDVARGEIIPGTGQEVEVSQLDEHGRYVPAQTETA